MPRLGIVTPAHRDNLRRLKAEFDAAFAAVPDFSDKGSPEFCAARELYRTWIKAIDAAAPALLDDLDALDEANRSEPQPARPRDRSSAVEAIRPGEVDHVFAEIDDGLHVRAMIDASDQDDIDIFGQ